MHLSSDILQGNNHGIAIRRITFFGCVSTMLVHELCHRFFGNFPNFFITAALQNVGQLPQISPEIIVMPCFPCSISFRKYVYTIRFADVFL